MEVADLDLSHLSLLTFENELGFVEGGPPPALPPNRNQNIRCFVFADNWSYPSMVGRGTLRKQSSGSVERTHQFCDPEGCTYQSSDPEGYTYQSSDPEGYTYQSSNPEGCTYQSSDPEGCTYQSSDPEGYTYP
ncbi:NBS-LRR type resistance protein [Cucumis melo var. makuwa]|uniref:NBS-LRR type resistance protein n=1 Tax=Cucumis melo var. makuwa TaxID=1194695 RepID=A0A5A7TQY8_CUCMM|nr:NBS-LRR type resistance protein [Cucumis melo var. makuwa]